MTFLRILLYSILIFILFFIVHSRYNRSILVPPTDNAMSQNESGSTPICVESVPSPIAISDSSSDISSDADSDLVEVAEIDSDIIRHGNVHYIEYIGMNKLTGADLAKDFRLSDLKRKPPPIEVVVDPSIVKGPDVLFADIFEQIEGKKEPLAIAEEPQPSTSKCVSQQRSSNIDTGSASITTVGSKPIAAKSAALNDILHELVNNLNDVMKKGVPNILNDDVEVKPGSTGNVLQTSIVAMAEEQTKNTVEQAESKLSGQEIELEIVKEATENLTEIELESYSGNSNIQTVNSDVISEQTVTVLESPGKIHFEKTPPQTPQTVLPKVFDLSNILQDLDKDLSSVKSIKISSLDDKLPTKASVAAQPVTEVIEILDDNDILIRTPVKSNKQSQISDYLKSDRKIKKTPEILCTEEKDPNAPKIVAPYFRSKTPSTGKKSSAKVGGEHSQTFSQRKTATKKLFAENVAIVVRTTVDQVNECTSTDQLTAMASAVRQEKQNLEFERNKQDRGAVSVTERMGEECRQLLKLFGIPYIIAPMEAEAQCAFLDAVKLTDGTITDDSDIWLFGGETVYKNFFNQQKLVLEYRVETIDRLFNVNREKMIQLAMLVGSDYTAGEYIFLFLFWIFQNQR